MTVVLVLAVVAGALVPVTVVAGLVDAYHLVTLLQIVRRAPAVTARALRAAHRATHRALTAKE